MMLSLGRKGNALREGRQSRFRGRSASVDSSTEVTSGDIRLPLSSPTPTPNLVSSLTMGVPAAPKSAGIRGVFEDPGLASAPLGLVALLLALFLFTAAWRRRKKKAAYWNVY